MYSWCDWLLATFRSVYDLIKNDQSRSECSRKSNEFEQSSWYFYVRSWWKKNVQSLVALPKKWQEIIATETINVLPEENEYCSLIYTVHPRNAASRQFPSPRSGQRSNIYCLCSLSNLLAFLEIDWLSIFISAFILTIKPAFQVNR